MQVSDKFYAYFSAVKLDPTLSSKQDIAKNINENSQRFSYGSVTYSAYEGKYRSKGNVQRKIVAIPAALWAGIVKSIYHLAKAIFYGIPKACVGESRHIKADVYRIARDMEEALGWLVTLINDKRGSYLIQESLFQKECYNYFENTQKKAVSSPSNSNYSFSFSRSFINGVEIPHYEEAQKITLLNFREMNSEARQVAINKFQLQSNVDAFGQENFFQKLNEADEHALELVNLVDLKMDVKTSKLKYVLLNNEEFKKVTVSQLEDASPDQISIVSQRIGDLKALLPQEEFNANVLDLPIIYFYQIPGQKISEVINKIPESVFALITDSQLEKLNLKNAYEKQINQLFCYIDGKEEKRRFALLSVDQVQAILGKLGEYQLKLISDNQLNKLDLKNIPADRLQKLFCYIDGKEEKRRFASLPSAQVQIILEKLGEYQLKLISDDHLKELDFSGLSQEKIQRLFCYIDGKEEKRRFALLSVDQVQAIFNKLGEYQLQLISDKQLNKLNLKNIPADRLQKIFCYIDGKEEKRRFASLPSAQVQVILEKLGEYQLMLISDDHLKELDFSGLSQEKIQRLFCYIDGKEEKRRFALLSVDQVQAIFNKLGEYQLQLISDKQLNKLDLKNIPADRLQKIFCYIDGKEEKRRFASLPSAQVQVILEKLGEYQLKLISDDHLNELDFLGLSQEKIQRLFCYIDGKEEKRRFAILSVDQVQAILGKLGEYQLKLISDEQFKNINLNSLSKEKINLLFPSFSKESIRLEYKGKHYSFSSTYKYGRHTVNEQIGISEEEVDRISAERKKMNIAKLALLSPNQILGIKDKLRQENLELIKI